MIIDIHGHLGNINQAPFWAADAKQLEQYCQKAGVDLLCISSAKSIMYDAMEGNRDLDAALKNSEHLLGYVTVSPVFPESKADLRLLKSNPKFKGVKVHPDYHGFDMASLRAVEYLDQIAEQVELMLFHVSCMPGTGFADAVRIAEFAARHPRTNFIMAHMAGIFQNGNYPYFPNLQGCENVAAMKLKNVFIDTAHFLMYVYPGVMERMVEIVGAKHIVFGTDAPLQGPMQMRFAIEVIQALDIPQSDKELILGGNAKKLLKLK
ncbi:MAG: amidohydrolase family protein [Lentisphaerae bacterium]|jgi:predicted TIM-barrel fold metal-dependent hydrolase|nr:amidohydrolase family protein [Lentisphaerota bacterium]